MNTRWESLMLDLRLLRLEVGQLFTSFVSGLRWAVSSNGLSRAVGEQVRRIAGVYPAFVRYAKHKKWELYWRLPSLLLFVLLIPTLGWPKTSPESSPLVLASPMETQCHMTVDVRLLDLSLAQKAAERMKCRLIVLGTFPDNPNWMNILNLGARTPLHQLIRRDQTTTSPQTGVK